jgi:hypothetical protein
VINTRLGEIEDEVGRLQLVLEHLAPRQTVAPAEAQTVPVGLGGEGSLPGELAMATLASRFRWVRAPVKP